MRFLDDKALGAASSDRTRFAAVDRLFSDELGLLTDLALALDPLAALDAAFADLATV